MATIVRRFFFPVVYEKHHMIFPLNGSFIVYVVALAPGCSCYPLKGVEGRLAYVDCSCCFSTRLQFMIKKGDYLCLCMCAQLSFLCVLWHCGFLPQPQLPNRKLSSFLVHVCPCVHAGSPRPVVALSAWRNPSGAQGFKCRRPRSKVFPP